MPPTPPLPQLLKNRDRDRLQQHTAAPAFDEGKQWPAADPRTRSARRLTLNYVKTIINKTSTYVMQGAAINAIPQSDSEEHVAAAAAVEQYLAALATDNGLTRLDLVTEMDAAVLGDAAYKITWDPAEERVAITAPDVRGLFPWPPPTDPTRTPQHPGSEALVGRVRRPPPQGDRPGVQPPDDPRQQHHGALRLPDRRPRKRRPGNRHRRPARSRLGAARRSQGLPPRPPPGRRSQASPGLHDPPPARPPRPQRDPTHPLRRHGPRPLRRRPP